jgi:hypothetical protein
MASIASVKRAAMRCPSSVLLACWCRPLPMRARNWPSRVAVPTATTSSSNGASSAMLPASTVSPDARLHRLSFAGQQRLVDSGARRPQASIDRHRFAARHADVFARAQFAERDRRRVAVFIDAIGVLVLGRSDQLQALGGAVARDCFDMARAAEQRDEHHRRIEIHDGAAADRFDHRRDIGEADRQRDQHIHARAAQRQLAPGAAKEREARIEHHGRGDQHRDDAEEVAGADIEFAGAPVQGFGEHHRLHRAEAGDDESFQRLPALALGVDRVLHDARRIPDGGEARGDRAERRTGPDRNARAHAWSLDRR